LDGENSERTTTLDVPFISVKSRGVLITNAVGVKDFIKSDIDFLAPVIITIYPYDGFVIKTFTSEDKASANN
jgi:hypothetical protein